MNRAIVCLLMLATSCSALWAGDYELVKIPLAGKKITVHGGANGMVGVTTVRGTRTVRLVVDGLTVRELPANLPAGRVLPCAPDVTYIVGDSLGYFSGGQFQTVETSNLSEILAITPHAGGQILVQSRYQRFGQDSERAFNRFSVSSGWHGIVTSVESDNVKVIGLSAEGYAVWNVSGFSGIVSPTGTLSRLDGIETPLVFTGDRQVVVQDNGYVRKQLSKVNFGGSSQPFATVPWFSGEVTALGTDRLIVTEQDGTRKLISGNRVERLEETIEDFPTGLEIQAVYSDYTKTFAHILLWDPDSRHHQLYLMRRK